MTATALGQLNPVSMLAHVVYDVANSITSVVGLTPLQVVEGLAVLLVCSFIVQIVQSLRGRASWHLNPTNTVKADDVSQMRKELEN